MSSATADCATATSTWFLFKQGGVDIRKVFQLQSRNFLADETFDCLQCGKLLAAHEGEGVANILSASGAPDPMDVIFRMLGHIIIDYVTDTCDVESP